jgi:hypothetical protein
MISDILKDRNYYRQLTDEALIALASTAQNELAYVLAERLEDANVYVPKHGDDE